MKAKKCEFSGKMLASTESFNYFCQRIQSKEEERLKITMNTLLVAGFILLIAIGGTLFLKYQDRKMAKE